VSIDIDFEWPLVRLINSERFLIVEGGGREHPLNHTAWVIKSSGKIEQELNLGYPSNICLTNDKIIATYSKSYLSTNRIFAKEEWEKSKVKEETKPISSEGLCVFDFEGNCLFRYMTDAKQNNFIPIMEIASLSSINDDEVYLLADTFEDRYTILQFNLINYSIRKVMVIEHLISPNFYPRAITQKNGEFIL